MGEVFKKIFQNEVVFSSETDEFNNLRKKYLVLSKDAMKEMDALYDEKLSEYSAFREISLKEVKGLLLSFLKEGVYDLISHNIFDIDEIVLREELKKDLGLESEKATLNTLNQLDRIDLEQLQADQERKQMIADAGDTVHTVGFVSNGNILQDAHTMASSAVEDAALNAAIAGGTALITAGFRHFEKKAAKEEQLKIYERAATKQDILFGIEADVYNLHKTLARIINEREGKEYFYYPSEESKTAFEPIVRNIISGNFAYDKFDAQLEIDRIVDAILLDPYDTRVYTYIKKSHPECNDELMDIVNYLCIDIASMADEYLKSVYNLANYNTYEEILEFIPIIYKELEDFGIKECNFSKQAESKKEYLYEVRRTFREFTYETIEDRDAAEEQFVNFFDPELLLEEMSIEELRDKYYQTFEDDIYEKNKQDLQAIIIVPLGKLINKVDTMEEVMVIIEEVDQKQNEHNIESTSLSESLEKRRKAIERRDKMIEATAQAKEKALELAGSAKNLGTGAVSSVKDLSGNLTNKIPFGKKASSDDLSEENSSLVKSIPKPSVKLPSFGKGNKEEGKVKNQMENTANEGKACPQCSATVKAAAKFCFKCGYRF